MKKQVSSTKSAAGKSAKSKVSKAATGRATASAKASNKVQKAAPSRSLEIQEREHAVRIKTAIDKVSTAIMMVDRNFIVTYVNDTTKQMLVKHAEHFHGLWPGFTPEGIMGACIDVFHKNPAHQRTMLADPKILPHRTDITVGPLRFSLCVNASYDSHGTYNGNILEWADVTEIRKKEALNNDYAGQIAAISKSLAVVEFHMDGTIFSANQNYLHATGFSLDEIIGKHHSIVVEESEKRSSEYRDFWASLNRGEYQTGEYKQLGRNGREIWTQASFNPILDLKGKPFKVVEYATDITEEKLKAVDIAGQIAAIGQTMAMIEFNMDGIVQNANSNFLNALGYTLDEIKGKHHSMFVEESHKHSEEYRQFWEGLKRGDAQNRQCKRIRRNGAPIWLQASYNTLLDLNGRPFKVIKFATDITVEKTREEQLSRAMAETSRVMQAVAVGDFSDSMQGTFEGEFAKLRDSVNGCADNLRRMMAETGRIMKGLAGGDLRNSIEGTYEGEFGDLADSVNSCVENLRKTVEQIRHSVSTMTTSSAEIASGNMDLSQRTEEQASSLTLTAANMEEITQTVKQNADNARQADLLAGSARDQAERGGTVVKNAIAAMGSINEASNRIADIIGVIDEIAFQTNLLALNAAVEAARAGEQGRGFAVVAAEVRNLAQRSAGAAKEIKGLIKDSVVRVEEGSRLVNESGVTLESIVQAAKKVSDIIAEIAAASTQQSAGIEKVTEAVQQMDAAVQQNSALVEETSAASNMMDDQAQSMSTLIDFFKLAGGNLLSPTQKPAARTRQASTSHAQPRPAQAKKPVPNSRPAFDSQPDFAMSEEF